MTRPTAQRPPRSHLEPSRLASQRAAEILTPDLAYARAIYCQTLERLWRDQQRLEEALALAHRARAPFETFGTSVELGRAEIELGWTLLQAGEPAEALAIFGPALELVRAAPMAAAGHLGLALALLETNAPGTLETADVDSVLAEAHQAIAAMDEPLARLRLRWLAAHLTFCRGRRWSAIRRLLRILNAFVNLSEDHDAAQVLLDLLTLCHECEWLKILARPELRRAFAVLGASPALHRRARNVLAFLAYAPHLPSYCAGVVLLHARCYLKASRCLSALLFQPTHCQPLIVLDWDELAPALRRTICREIEIEETAGDLSSRQIEIDFQETISWRFEIVQRARIVFAGCRAEPLAPWV
jgi:tetratricopeptide (TPR) repeat protein